MQTGRGLQRLQLLSLICQSGEDARVQFNPQVSGATHSSLASCPFTDTVQTGQ